MGESFASQFAWRNALMDFARVRENANAKLDLWARDVSSRVSQIDMESCAWSIASAEMVHGELK